MGGTKVVPSSTYLRRQAAVNIQKRALNYDMLAPLQGLINLRASVVPLTLVRPEIWFFTIVHTALVIMVKRNFFETCCNQKFDPGSIELPFASIGMSSTLMGFMLIFFNNQTFSRYQGYYAACTGIGGTMQVIAQDLQVHLADYPAIRWDICRHLIASVLLVYMKVTDEPGTTPTIDEEEWERLLSSEEAWQGIETPGKQSPLVGSPALLTAAEKDILAAQKGNLPTLTLQTWALRAAREGYKKAGVEAPIFCHMQGAIHVSPPRASGGPCGVQAAGRVACSRVADVRRHPWTHHSRRWASAASNGNATVM